MRTFFPILVALTFTIKLSAAETNAPAQPKTGAAALLKIGTADADKHFDEEVIVTGKVAQVTIRPKVIFLNLDRPHPDSPFTVVIFPGTYLADVKALDGKAVEIRGKIKNYHDKPEIVLDSTNQLTVLGPITLTNAPPVPAPNHTKPAPAPATNSPDIM